MDSRGRGWRWRGGSVVVWPGSEEGGGRGGGGRASVYVLLGSIDVDGVDGFVLGLAHSCPSWRQKVGWHYIATLSLLSLLFLGLCLLRLALALLCRAGAGGMHAVVPERVGECIVQLVRRLVGHVAQEIHKDAAHLKLVQARIGCRTHRLPAMRTIRTCPTPARMALDCIVASLDACTCSRCSAPLASRGPAARADEVPRSSSSASMALLVSPSAPPTCSSLGPRASCIAPGLAARRSWCAFPAATAALCGS